LRAYCPKLASSLAAQQAEHIRDDICALLFKALMVDSPAIHKAAQSALQEVMVCAKFPKNLLQNSLRPILQNLGNYRHLTLTLLHGLGRLLELLSDW
jgi:transformation/transcription domain-associated protein